ncbi:MAG TPA: ATP12 family protein [Stellaceae bacterium]|jgi:chaperone required for assembly of F1-ATPase
MKRFYRNAAVAPRDTGHGVTLDGKPLRTPTKAELLVPSRALADAIAAEWQAQSDDIVVTAMPLTRLVSTAIDLVSQRRDAVIEEIANYAGTDLVCYRATHPPELVKRQQMVWQPLLNWLTEYFDAPLHLATGVTPVAQPAESLAALKAAVAAHDTMMLTALRLATAASGSVVIALALLRQKFDSDAAFAAAELDESFQIENWGEDPEQTKRRAGLRDDLKLAERFANLLR